MRLAQPGPKPDELLIEQPTKLDLVVHPKTATALGLTRLHVPPEQGAYS